jgi:small conductance mechanosensitive channel
MEAIRLFFSENRDLVLTIVILCFALVITRVIRWLMNKSFVTASEKIKVDPTRYRFLKNATTLIIWCLALAAITYMIPKLRALAVTMFAGAGVFLAILGFAAQQAFSNIVSGIFIVIFKPFRVGDLVQIGEEQMGFVEDITLRHTVITSFENKRIIIPNSVISSETVVNSDITDHKICELIVFEISFESDIDLAMSIMTEEAVAHPMSIDNRTRPEFNNDLPVVQVFVVGFGESSVKLRAGVWASSPLIAREMHYDLNKSIKQRFDREGIEIPYPHRKIVNGDVSKSKSSSS